MHRSLTTLISWSSPAPLVTLSAAIVVCQGSAHPWVFGILIFAATITVVTTILSIAMSIALHKKNIEGDRELIRLQESYQLSDSRRRSLQYQIDNLSGMREISMSSQIESFSELLRSALTATHVSTGAATLTLYLESRDQVGSIYPKAHINWNLQEPNKDPNYLYFDEEIVLNTMSRDTLDGFKPRHEPGNRHDDRLIETSLLHNGRRIGLLQLPSGSNLTKEELLKRVETEANAIAIQTIGTLECWQSRSPNHRSSHQQTTINVPIFSQSTIIGTLQAEVGTLGEQRSLKEIVKLQARLRELTVSIGQPLRKEQLYDQATKDPMTGLFNKALYQQQLHDHFHRCQRFQRPLAYIFLDIDHFKNINDQYGHLTGDLALKAVSRIISENIRQSDIAFRFGGEELCILLPESNEADGNVVAEKIRKTIEDTDFPTDKDMTIRFTASLGVACSNSEMRNPEELAKAADDSVYAAKRSGRNRVILHSRLSAVQNR